MITQLRVKKIRPGTNLSLPSVGLYSLLNPLHLHVALDFLTHLAGCFFYLTGHLKPHTAYMLSAKQTLWILG